MNFYLKVITLVFGSFVWAGPVLADVTGELTDRLKQYETLSGEFKQTIIDENNELIEESSGFFVLKKPGAFFWETVDPFPQLLVSDLTTIWLYDPDLEQVTIRPYTQQVGDSPAILLSGDAQKISENYSIEKVENQSEHFLLKPINQQSTFVELYLIFEEKILSQMIVKDTLQQTTTFTFSEIQVNKTFPEERFIFVPPEGVDVIIDE